MELPSLIPTMTLNVGIIPCKTTKNINKKDKEGDEENNNEMEYLNNLKKLSVLFIEPLQSQSLIMWVGNYFIIIFRNANILLKTPIFGEAKKFIFFKKIA